MLSPKKKLQRFRKSKSQKKIRKKTRNDQFMILNQKKSYKILDENLDEFPRLPHSPNRVKIFRL